MTFAVYLEAAQRRGGAHADRAGETPAEVKRRMAPGPTTGASRSRRP